MPDMSHLGFDRNAFEVSTGQYSAVRDGRPLAVGAESRPTPDARSCRVPVFVDVTP
jgi:hypothetical protein